MLVKEIPMVLVFVSDLPRSVAWYQDTLELPLLYQAAGFASFQVGQQRLALHTSEQASQVNSNSGSIPVLQVEDYPAAKATLESRGCQFYFENTTPNATFGSFRDPDGNPLQIMQNLKKE